MAVRAPQAPPPQQNCMLMAELGRLIRNLHQHHAFNCKNQQGEDAQDDENVSSSGVSASPCA